MSDEALNAVALVIAIAGWVVPTVLIAVFGARAKRAVTQARAMADYIKRAFDDIGDDTWTVRKQLDVAIDRLPKSRSKKVDHKDAILPPPPAPNDLRGDGS